MVRMYCMGTTVEIPKNGRICPTLPTNFVPKGLKCDIVCDLGTPSVSFIKCEYEGWSNKDVTCNAPTSTATITSNSGFVSEASNVSFAATRPTVATTATSFNMTGSTIGNVQITTGSEKSPGTPTGLIVGLLVGGFIGVCVLIYIYARLKRRKKNMKNIKQQPPYRSLEHNYEGNSGTNSTKSATYSRRPKNSTNNYSPFGERKHKSCSDECAENVDLGFHDGHSTMVLDGRYRNAQDDEQMHQDYCGQPSGNSSHYNAYGATDHNCYNKQEQGGYVDQSLISGDDNMGIPPHGGGFQKPYHVPI